MIQSERMDAKSKESLKIHLASLRAPWLLGSLIAFGVLGIFAAGVSQAFALAPACRAHDPRDLSVPECPDSVAILPDSFPAMAVSVSDALGKDFARDFVLKALRAQRDKPPQLLLNAKAENFKYVKESIAKAAPDPATREKWLAALTHASAKSFIWQQDIFQSFADPETGRPKLKGVLAYEVYSEQGVGIARGIMRNAKAECEIGVGPLLGDFEFVKKVGRESLATGRDGVSGLTGGNLEGVPGGFCAIGLDHLSKSSWRSYAAQVCGGNIGNVIAAPTSFLKVGHVDEIFSTVKVAGAKAPCDFAFMFASPAEGERAGRVEIP